jgi:uncharacterized membrane protein YoaT (DUF817 family)
MDSAARIATQEEIESAVKLHLLGVAERIYASNPGPWDEPASGIKEIYRMLVALYNEKL